MMQKNLSVLALAGVVLLTAGCGEEATMTSESAAMKRMSVAERAAAALANIEVTNFEEGAKPTVTFPVKPFAVAETAVKVLEEGDGDVVAADATVNVHYHGVNGTSSKVFDSSFDRGQPVTFPLQRVIPGFSKSIAGQKYGSKLLVAIPPKDGYGEKGAPEAGIGPKDTLVFLILVNEPTK